MNNEIEVSEVGKFVLVKVPLWIPKSLYDSGAVEIMATEDGWTEKSTSDEGVEIDNPVSALLYNVKKIQQNIKDKFKAIMTRRATQQVDKDFETLFLE